ncbi:cupin domain-containing protein [Candidatus Bathyarchaeota archaeon]|nr:cupin domain-containing protein [Candidatus Bathyarchaeota archaeon]MBS7630780.1 cupin domain-containing protein [Candidatus Bathyarchaeota archaeon]
MKSMRLEEAPTLQPIKGFEMFIIGNGKTMTLIKIIAQPGAKMPEHKHNSEQIGTCLEGEGELTSGGETQVKPGISWVIPSNEPHSFIALGDKPVVLTEAWSPPREDYLEMAKRRKVV